MAQTRSAIKRRVASVGRDKRPTAVLRGFEGQGLPCEGSATCREPATARHFAGMGSMLAPILCDAHAGQFR